MKLAALLAVGLSLLQLVAATAATAQEGPSLSAARCAGLAGMTIPAAQIGLPTSGAKVTTASMVPADTQGQGHPDFCLVVGEIAPVDKSAPNIEFNVGLPATWNVKAFMLGGGGFDGFIPPVTGGPFNTAGGPPLARGYAVFSSDSGHKSPPGPAFALDASFMQNREAFLNWEGDALKKTHDAAFSVIQQAYGKRPTVAYFAGGSGGGREALVAPARWPADWDAAIALYPARGLLVALGALRNSQALAAPGAYLPMPKRALLYQAALERCDGLDGVKDGVISNVRGCRAVFDPATATLNGVPLRCPGGADTGPNCLSDAELAALQKIDRSFALPFASAPGDASLPGFNVYTSDTGRPPTSQAQGAVTFFAFGMAQPATPPGPGMPFFFSIADQVVRYMITQDADFDPLKFDIDHPGRYAARLRELSRLDARDFEMGAFARKGGKLLILQGTDDMEVSPRATEAYVGQLRQSVGGAAVARMVRFYEVPGFAHTTSTIFSATWDPVSAIEGWVEHGVDPADHLVVTDTIGVPGRTRPLCPYPMWPRYKSGDVNAALSFFCALH